MVPKAFFPKGKKFTCFLLLFFFTNHTVSYSLTYLNYFIFSRTRIEKVMTLAFPEARVRKLNKSIIILGSAARFTRQLMTTVHCMSLIICTTLLITRARSLAQSECQYNQQSIAITILITMIMPATMSIPATI